MQTSTSFPRTKTSPLAVASFILSLAGFTLLPWLGSIFAIITGKLALSEIRSNLHRYDGEGLAKAAVALGWLGAVGLFVIALLAVLFLAPLHSMGPVMLP